VDVEAQHLISVRLWALGFGLWALGSRLSL
jgi:hypothetical protein